MKLDRAETARIVALDAPAHLAWLDPDVVRIMLLASCDCSCAREALARSCGKLESGKREGMSRSATVWG